MFFMDFYCLCIEWWPPLWSSDHGSWLQVQVRVRFPAQPDFLRSGSGTGSTQPRNYNWGATWKKSSSSGLEIREYGHRDPLRWPRGTLYPQKLALTSPTCGGRPVGIGFLQAQATEFVFFFVACIEECIVHLFVHTTTINFKYLWDLVNM
jgi:hypothetical protein